MIVHHLYTTSGATRGHMVSAGCSPRGVAFYAPIPVPGEPDALPFYRYRIGSDHTYTTDPRDILPVNIGANAANVYESIACYLYARPAAGRSPLYELYRSSPLDHFYTPSKAECQSVNGGGGYALQRAQGYVLTDSASATVRLFRSYNASVGDHFYTTSSVERDLASGYAFEDIYPIFVPESRTDIVPVYQLQNTVTGAPSYTSSRDEVTRLLKSSGALLTFDGAVFYLFSRRDDGSGQDNRVPVYLLTNPALESQIYTTSPEERDRALAELGYLDAGIAGYAARSPSADAAPVFVCAKEARSRVVSAAFNPPRGASASNWLLSAERRYPSEARFSKAPGDALREARERGYQEVLIQEGAPLLDRDLNALGDLAAGRVYEAIERRVGNGIMTTDAHGDKGFAVEPVSDDPMSPANDDDFMISAGSFLIGGVVVTCPSDLRYRAQAAPDGAELKPWSAPRPWRRGDPEVRVDIVYLDAWVEEQSGSDNAMDLGAQTTTLSTPKWLVRVAEGAELPPERRGHRHCPIAAILRPALGERRALVSRDQIVDLRVRVRALAEIEERVSQIRQAARLDLCDINGKYMYIQQPTVSRGSPFVVTGPRARPGKVVATIDGQEVPARPVDAGWFGAGIEITIPAPFEPGSRYLIISNGFGSVAHAVELSSVAPNVSTSSVPTLSRYPQGDSFVLQGQNMDLVRAVRFARQGASYTTTTVVTSDEKVRVYYKAMDVGAYSAYVITPSGGEVLVPATINVQ